MSETKQVISAERVADYGEVLTAELEVEAMLDLVSAEAARIDQRRKGKQIETQRNSGKTAEICNQNPRVYVSDGRARTNAERCHYAT